MLKHIKAQAVWFDLNKSVYFCYNFLSLFKGAPMGDQVFRKKNINAEVKAEFVLPTILY